MIVDLDLASSGVGQFLIADDFYCGNPAPRRSAFCVFHSEVAAIYRKADVSSRAERKAGELLAKNPKATGTRGKLPAGPGRGKRVKNGACDLRAPFSEADAEPEPLTLTQMGIECVSVSLLDLNQGMCKFPLGDPTEESFRFCGAPSAFGRPYCIYHHTIAHEQRPAVRRRNQPNELRATPWVSDPAFVSPGIG